MALPNLQDPYDEDDEDSIRPSFSSLPTGGVREGDSHVGKLKSVPNEPAGGNEDLSGAETSGASGASAGSDSKDERQGLRLIQGGKSDSEEAPSLYHEDKEGSLRARAKGKLKKRLLISAGAVGGLGIMGTLLFLIFIAGSLLIPNLAQNITAYQFARLTREYAESETRVTDENIAIDAIPETADDSLYNSVKEKFVSAGQKTADLWNRLSVNYQVDKSIANLSANNGFNITSHLTKTGRQVIDKVVLDDTPYAIKTSGFVTGHIPVLSDIIDFTHGVSFSRDFAPDLSAALREQDVGIIVRLAAAKEIREKLGISLIAWVVGKYSGKTPSAARVEQTEDLAEDVDQQQVPDPAVTDSLNNAQTAAVDDEKSILSNPNPAEIEATIADGGYIKSVQTAISNVLAASGLSTAITIINPIYAVAMPICIVYDGSMDHSGPTIDDQVRQQEAAYYYIASANSQEAAGATTAQAVGALNSDLNAGGNIQESIPLLRGAGDAVSSTGAPSAEASADGQYTLLNATPGLSAVAGPINDVADEACPVFTNMIGAGFLGLASLGVGLLTGETDTAAGTLATKTIDEGAADAATEVAADQTADVASSVITKSGVVTRRIWKLLDDTVTSAGKITAMTILAKLIVMDRAMQVNSGFAEGVDLANEADSGGNIAANEIDRQGMYGAPLTGTQVAQSNVADQQYVASENSQKSAYQRYFALSNTDSLLSKFSTDLYEHVNASSFSSIFSSLGRDLNPISLLAKVFGSIDTKLTFAQSATDDYTYGNVQFGWSQDEDNLINSNQSYQPIENQAALDSAAPILNPSTGTNEDAEDYISGIYGQCFTDSIGTLLSSGLIVRDASGNVISSTGNVDNTSSPEGLCSPDNLGPDNPKYGDLVFRWRLAMNYSNTLDQLTQEGSLSVPSGSN